MFCEQNTPVSFNNSYLPDLSYQIKSSFFISPILLEMSLSCQGFYRKKIRCAEKEQQKKETLTLISTSLTAHLFRFAKVFLTGYRCHCAICRCSNYLSYGGFSDIPSCKDSRHIGSHINICDDFTKFIHFNLSLEKI